MAALSKYFLLFMIYAIIGYICEVLYVYYYSKKWVNRGFCFGPYIPIYGAGSLIVTFLLTGYYNDPIVVLVMGMIFCASLEYFTSYLMEKIFHNRWWDYSSHKYNINGRVCLKNTILFGIGSLAIIYLINPIVFRFIDELNPLKMEICALILLVIFLTDLTISIVEAYRINNITANLERILNEYTKNKNIKLNKIKTRFYDAFPDLINNQRVVQRLKALKKDFKIRKKLKKKK